MGNTNEKMEKKDSFKTDFT